MKKEIVTPPSAKGTRLDKFLHQTLKAISRTKITTHIEKGDILTDGEQKKASYVLKGKETISLNIKEEKKELRPFEFKVNIIYEDTDVLVVDKPAGLTTHPPQAGYDQTLVNALLYMKKELFGAAKLRPGVVHRLDKETSGVMVLAKNKHSHDRLIEQFKKRKIKKEYRAICWGVIKKDKLSIDMPLARDAKNRLKMKVSFIKSKSALTRINVLERLKEASFISLDLLTGRMHQIRVHLKFLGYPLVGDKKYGIKDKYDNLFLHAYRLGFYHPRTDEFIEFSSKLPGYFDEFIKKERCLQ
jgi:23S rRNA pseudouridine1911/1915/1917 synthase